MTQAKELQGVIKNLESIGLIELMLQFVNWTFINGKRLSTLQTGEVVTIFLSQTVEGLSTGQRPHLDGSFKFQGIKCSIHGCQTHPLAMVAKFNIQILC